jgi:predicted ATPase
LVDETMLELNAGFQSLPPEYQRVLGLAQEQHQIQVAPLQTLVGGWSGAMVFLVSVTHLPNRNVEHLILKLDRKSKTARSDELSRHAEAQSKSPPDFARKHFADLAFERIEADGAIAIFYSIAGQSLQSYRPLSSYNSQHQLEAIFAATNQYLLREWNANAVFFTLHPQEVLQKWLGFRLDQGAPIETFIRYVCRVEPDRQGLLIEGNVFSNPLWYARHREAWGNARPIDVPLGMQHGDLNTNNILVKFSPNERELTGYYLIDFALFKSGMPLLYDLRYMEMSYLILLMSQLSLAKVVDLVLHLSENTLPDPSRVPVEMAGASAVISSVRKSFEQWVAESHPSLQDDLWGQYWLAGVAAGLSYCHKAGQADEQRLAGLIYAAANLKRYFASFGVPLPTDVEHLYSKGQFATGQPPGKPLAGRSFHNLPAQLTPFIGRTAQVAALRELILNPDVRLVTLLGPGGTGKTRISLQVAHQIADQFQQGIFFVPLADDVEASQLVSRIAQQLDVREGGRPLLENIKDYLLDKRMLLILDNFEQLISAASIVAELLAAAPQLKIITSSRIPLKLRSEYEFPVPPLDLPQNLDHLTMEELAGNESMQLFVERARTAQPAFALTRENVSAVVEICRHLDGLPLAIELAAARLKLLTPQAIQARLNDRFKLLTGGARDLPARQQTLLNTLEWSYSLLNEGEKTLLARLSVFVGGFTLEAAEEVCNLDGSFDILEGVGALVDNSLVRREETASGELRFGMLETIRAYALTRLAESGDLEALKEKHASYFGSVVLRVKLELYNHDALHWLNWLERENDNIRATLSWCLVAPQGTEMGVGLIFALFWFWYRRGHAIEGRIWTDRFLALPALQASSELRMTVLAASGMLSLWHGEQEMALARLQESLQIEYRVEDNFMTAVLQMANAIAYINMGRDSEAKPMLELARGLFQEIHLDPFVALTTVHLGNVELGLGNADQARSLHEQALAIAQAIGESWMITFALNNLGEVARVQGKYELARTYYEKCEAMLSHTGDEGDLARFVHSLGYIAQHEGDYARAESQFRKSLVMFRRLGNRRGMAECMAGLAGLRARQGDAQWGAEMLSAAEAVLKVTGGEWWPADRAEVEANQEVLRSALIEAELTAAQTKGRAITLEQALAFASEYQ